VPSVIGREEELRAAEAFLASPGGVAALVVLGEPGIGKTTVWEAAVDLARSGDNNVLVAQPAESEAKLSFAGLSDLLSPVPHEVLSLLPGPQRAALDAALLRDSSARTPERRAVGAGFLSVLRALAADGPVVLAIDDLQWLDSPSTAVLKFALRRLRTEPVRTIVTARSGTVGGLLAPLDRELQPTRIELHPMSVAALHRIVVNTLGRHLPRPTIVRIARASGGNPFYALEIARELGRAGDDTDAGRLPVPRGLDELVRRRVRALPARTREALLRAAALARPTTAAVEARDLVAAEEADLIRIEADGRIHFVHPLFASAVYAGAPLARRRGTHRALAAIVDDPEERARHLALAAESADARLLGELAQAACAARARGAPDSAAELTELALQFTAQGSADARGLQLELAEHLYLASDFQHAEAVLEELSAALEPGDLRARVFVMLAEIDYWDSGESAALTLAERALVDARDPLMRARCHVAIAMYAGTVDLPKAAAAARAAVALLEPRVDADPGLVAAALGAFVRAELFLGNGFHAETAKRALALEQSAPLAAVDTRVVFKLGQWLRYVDDFEGARRQLAQAEGQARDEGDDSSLANILLNRVILETWAGALADATELAERMVDAFAQLGLQTRGPNIWKTYVDAFAGRIDAVQAAAVAADMQEPVIAALWERTIGLAELAAGDPNAADRHLSRALSEFDRINFHEPAIWRVDGDAIEAAAATGDLERAERWASRFEERAARSQIPWSLAVSARCRGLVLAAQGALEPAADVLERALAVHERCPMPFEHARTLLIQGQVLRRLKRKRQARTSLEQARAIFTRLGAEPWVALAESELRRVAARRAPSDLTATERQIAELAASGLSNPEIARQVFVSRKTVESNLARVYRKLGISSRRQLEGALRREGASIS
jgi:DNA-binding CsgD family transcriptional regulator